MINPEWKQYQIEYYEQKRKEVEKKLEHTGDEEERTKLEEKLAKLQKPKSSSYLISN